MGAHEATWTTTGRTWVKKQENLINWYRADRRSGHHYDQNRGTETQKASFTSIWSEQESHTYDCSLEKA